jgi:hypothetical protein
VERARERPTERRTPIAEKIAPAGGNAYRTVSEKIDRKLGRTHEISTGAEDRTGREGMQRGDYGPKQL